MKAVLSVVMLASIAAGGWFGVQLFLPPVETGADPGAAAADSTATAALDTAAVDLAPLRAEIEALTERLVVAEAAADSLRDRLAQQSALADEARSDAGELATTLTKMEDAELEAVVQRLDGRSFVQLYEAASARNQVRLLGALTSEQAASFIRHQLPGGPARARAAAATARADSLSRS